MGSETRVGPIGHLPDDVRSRTVDFLREAVARGQLSLAQFESAVDLVMRATREAELAALVREVAPPVRITPVERQLQEPLEISSTGMFANVNLLGNWQVPRHLSVRTGPSRITIDLTEAEFDDWTVEIVAHAEMGDVTLIVPRGMAVQLVGTSGPTRSKLTPPVPGFPLVRLSATVGLGKIRFRHPKQSRP